MMSTLAEKANLASSQLQTNLSELLSELSDDDLKVVASYGRTEISHGDLENESVEELLSRMEEGLAVLFRRGAFSISEPKNPEAKRQLALLLKAYPAPIPVVPDRPDPKEVAENALMEEVIIDYNGRLKMSIFKNRCLTDSAYNSAFEKAIALGRI